MSLFKYSLNALFFHSIEDCKITSDEELWEIFQKLSAMYGHTECPLWLVCD